MQILDFVRLMIDNPALMITVLLVLAVIFVNGWTDAPNAIATVISTRAMRPRPAILMAAFFNFVGVAVMTSINVAVADTIYKMVSFGNDSRIAVIALCAALFAIVVWATAAWYFGIPTSESHALIAGVTGAAIAITGFAGAINTSQWLKVIYGLVLSTFLGFGSGFVVVKLVGLSFRRTNRRRADRFFGHAQIAGGAAMAFMHGAQDGQKFIGVLMLGILLAKGESVQAGTTLEISLPIMILCSLIMGIGTSVGGYRIIKAVGMDMVKLEKYQGFSADFAAAGCLLLSSLTGIPVSTTHTKTTAIMGVGAARRLSMVNWSVVRDMVLTWVLTFPGCGLIGFLMAKLFIHLF